MLATAVEAEVEPEHLGIARRQGAERPLDFLREERVHRLLFGVGLVVGDKALDQRPIALGIEGRIEPHGFEVSINGGSPICLTGEAGSDAHGAFVWVAPQEHAVGAEHALRVEADAHDVDASLAAVSFLELPRDQLARGELDYASRWYSVYFNALGLVDGCGSGGPRSLLPASTRGQQPS